MDNSIRTQLESLVGKKLHYEKQNIELKNFKEIAGNICIVTDVRTFQFYPNEIQEKFLDKISEPKEEGTFNPPSLLEKKSFVELPAENLTIKTALMEALQNLKSDPNFLSQAKGVCEIANTMINVQKTEIEMVKLQKNL